MKTVAYLRVSTRSQDLANQKLAILEFSQKRRFPIDQFIESRISSRQSPLERRIDEMLGTLEPGDRLLVSELSRLGRSLSQVIQIVETLVRRKIRFIAIKEAIEFDGKARMSPRPPSPRYWTSPAPPSTTSSRPARSLRADPKARTALMLYFNTNVGALRWLQWDTSFGARSNSSRSRSRSRKPSSPFMRRALWSGSVWVTRSM